MRGAVCVGSSAQENEEEDGEGGRNAPRSVREGLIEGERGANKEEEGECLARLSQFALFSVFYATLVVASSAVLIAWGMTKQSKSRSGLGRCVQAGLAE